MMMLNDHKKALMTIMRKKSAKGEPLLDGAPMKQDSAKDEDGEIDGRHAAAQDIIAALHEKSPLKLMAALANFHDLHDMKQESEEEESEE